MNNVVQRFLEAAHAHPEHTALVTREGAFSYQQFLQAVSNIRRALAGQMMQLGQQERIGVHTNDDMLTYAALFGIWASGAAYVPLHRENPRERQREILADAGVELVLASAPDEELEAVCQQANPPARILTLTQLEPAPLLHNERRIGPDTMAYLLYTSGSTGKPKGVPLYHRNLEAFLQNVLDPEQFSFSATDRFLQMFELTFDLSVFSFAAPLCLGASCHVVPAEGFGAMNVYDVLEEQAITVALKVPSVLGHLQRYFDEIELPALRYSLFCGEALPQQWVEEWARCVPNAQIENLYGPTEATIFCLRYRWEPELARHEQLHGIVPIGLPLPNMAVALMRPSEADGEAATSAEEEAPAEEGELCLIGPQVTTGYWQRPEKTAEAFPAFGDGANQYRAYLTGDLVQQSQRGNYQYVGRIDNQVKIEGHRVELGEIEHHAREFVGGAPVAALAVKTAGGHTVVHLCLEQFEGNEKALQQHLAAHLPDYMQPRKLHHFPALPLNRSGKIDRNELLRRVQAAETRRA